MVVWGGARSTYLLSDKFADYIFLWLVNFLLHEVPHVFLQMPGTKASSADLQTETQCWAALI